MKKLFRIFAGSLLCLMPINLFAQSDAEDAKLQSFFKDYLEQKFHQQPVAATALGDHRFDAQMDDISPAARARWLALLRDTAKALPKVVDYSKLSQNGQIDFQIFQHDLENRIWESENLHPFEKDPRTYGNYISDSIYLLLTQSTQPKETNIANCIARMAAIPRVIAEAEHSLTHPARPILETAIRQNRGAIDFYESDIFNYTGDTPQQAALAVAATNVVAALEDYQKFLEGPLRKRAEDNWRLGKKKFDKKFELETDAGITAEQNLADAQAEFASVREELYVVARQLWPRYFPDRNLLPDDPAGRQKTITKVIGQVNLDHSEATNLLADAQSTVASIKAFIRKRDYLQLPDPDNCAVIEMPEFRRGNSLAYLDNAPPLDPKAKSYYAVSPPPSDWTPAQKESYLEEYNRQMLKILTIHEAYPGHYVQLEYSTRQPSLIRRVLGSGTYIEGWAVYGEITMLNEGFGDGDLALRLMQLKFYLRAVANSILDYQMHCTQMTDAEAMKFLTQEAFQSEGEAKLKLIRAKQSSVQLSTYFVGRMAHYRLHQAIEREMGDQFSLAKYHEAVLDQGSVPVKYLPDLVRRQLGLTR